MKTFKLFLVAVCFLEMFINRSTALADENRPKIGDVPPPLILSEVVQGPAPTEMEWSKLKGKVVVLEFWNTACVGCVQAIPHLNELAGQFSNQVVFISISDDNADYLKKFLKRRPIKGWVVLDGLLNPTKSAFNLDGGISHTVIVDASGRIAAISDPATLLQKNHLVEILAGKPCNVPLSGMLSPVRKKIVADTNPAPVDVEVSIKGPFPQPKGAYNSRGWDWSKPFPDFGAEKAFLADVIPSFFDVSPKLVFAKTNLPEGLYDISAMASQNKMPELKRQFIDKLKTTFGISIQTKKQNVKVYVMTICSTNAPGMKRVQQRGGGGGRTGGFYLTGNKMDTMVSYIENSLDRPVINETGLTGLWAADVKWSMSASELENLDSKPDPVNVIQAVRKQLGLELTPTNRMVEVLEITKAKN